VADGRGPEPAAPSFHLDHPGARPQLEEHGVTVTRDGPGRDIRRTGGLAAGVLDLVLPLAACGTGEPAAGPEPTAISIASSTTGPSASPAPTTIPSAPASTASTDRGAPPSGQGLDAVGAVAAAQAAVADSTVVTCRR
jgi:hypothetical protein